MTGSKSPGQCDMKLGHQIVVFGILAIYVLCGCGQQEKVRAERQKQQIESARQEQKKKIKEFADRHAALAGWESALPRRGGDFERGPFTIDFTTALIHTNEQPVLFSNAKLGDV